MDDLNCCLSQIVHLCNEASIFLNQLYQFENQLDKFHFSSKISSRKYFSIFNRFSIILKDFNLYYKNHFFKFYLNIFHYLSRKYFTVNFSNEITEDFYEDITRLNYFLNRKEKKYYQNIFYYLHKLTTMCALCIQYRHTCTNIELGERFVCIRIDLLINLERLNEEIRILLITINSNFEQRKLFLIRKSKEKIEISNFYRTILLWLIVFILGYYFLWPSLYANESRSRWP